MIFFRPAQDDFSELSTDSTDSEDGHDETGDNFYFESSAPDPPSEMSIDDPPSQMSLDDPQSQMSVDESFFGLVLWLILWPILDWTNGFI